MNGTQNKKRMIEMTDAELLAELEPAPVEPREKISLTVADARAIEAVLAIYGPDSTVGGLVKALAVLIQTPGHRARLVATDPMALAQARAALKRAAEVGK